MSDADGRADLGSAESTREYGSLGLVFACVVALLLATALLPMASAVGLGGAPAESLIPGPSGATGSGGGEAQTGGSGVPGSGGSSFGALNVGGEQSVGGSIASAEEGNPYRSQDAAVHFLVSSSEPGYWRTGAFDTYTGDGWSQSGTSDTTAPIDGREVRYEVELAASASSLPTVWQPERVTGPEGLQLTDGDLARADGRLPAGTTYEGVSKQPPREESVLASSGRDYPARIQERYTGLPEQTESRLGPFTSNLTAEADSPYETAVEIERWLETNKSYSLSVGEPTGDDVASQFVFDMDRGYCEYFATSMVAMLRSQDVPARYVVGYSTGEQVDDNTYRVRAMNAHAWVEVYFADVGWVRFDPTPGQDRLAEERQAVQAQDPTASYEPEEEGSPNETFTPDGTSEETPEPGTVDDTREGDSTDDGTPDGPPPPGDSPSTPPDDVQSPDDGDDSSDGSGEFDIEVNRSVVPGASVEVTVTMRGLPVADAIVSFGGEIVGRTGSDGTVTATVPFVENLTVTAEKRSTSSAVDALDRTGADVSTLDRETDESDADRANSSTGSDDGQSAVEDRRTVDSVADADRTGASGPERVDAQDDEINGTRTFDVETNGTLTVSGDAHTGADIIVTAAVADVPIKDAPVWLDGERVGRTDEDGRAAVTLPDEPGNVTLRVARSPVEATERVELVPLTVDVEPRWPLPIAGTPVDVTASLGDEPAAGATVRVGDEAIGETGVNGTLAPTLPADSSVPVAVSAHGQTATRTVSNPLANLAGILGLALAAALGGAFVLWRRDEDARRFLSRLVAGVRSLPAALVASLVLAARTAERALLAVAGRAERTLAHLRALVTGQRSPAEVAAAFRAWLGAWLDRLRDGSGRAVSRVSPTAGRPRGRGSTADSEAARRTVRESWSQFLDHVTVRRPRTKTPGQLAAHAIATDDLPADAVRTLRDEFRAVEYGPRSPDESVPAVEAAIEAIETAVQRDEDETASAPQRPAGRADD